MVVDKETKMRETLRIMSMKTGAYGLSYFLTQLVFVVFISFLMAMTFALVGFFEGADNIWFFLLMIFNGIAMTFFSMSITTLFSDSKISIQIGSLLTTMPLALFIGFFNISLTNPWRLYLGFVFPHFPTTILVCKMAG